MVRGGYASKVYVLELEVRLRAKPVSILSIDLIYSEPLSIPAISDNQD